MTKRELEILQQIAPEENLIDISMLADRSDRTLLWGYTCARSSWHVYIGYGDIQLYCYEGIERWRKTIFHKELNKFEVEEVIPDKRLYPEACDYEFCKLLKSKGAYLPFTIYQENRPYSQFYGEVL